MIEEIWLNEFAKVGDRVKLKYDAQFRTLKTSLNQNGVYSKFNKTLIGEVIYSDAGTTYLSLDEKSTELLKGNYASSKTRCVELGIDIEQHPNVIHFNQYVLGTILPPLGEKPKAPVNTMGFLFGCLAAGATVQHLTGNQKTKKETTSNEQGTSK